MSADINYYLEELFSWKIFNLCKSLYSSVIFVGQLRTHDLRKMYFDAVKSYCGCAICGTRDVNVLTFHHFCSDEYIRRMGGKEFVRPLMGENWWRHKKKRMSTAVRMGFNTMRDEARYGDIVCRDCHDRLHYYEDTTEGFYRLSWQDQIDCIHRNDFEIVDEL